MVLDKNKLFSRNVYISTGRKIIKKDSISKEFRVYLESRIKKKISGITVEHLVSEPYYNFYRYRFRGLKDRLDPEKTPGHTRFRLLIPELHFLFPDSFERVCEHIDGTLALDFNSRLEGREISPEQLDWLDDPANAKSLWNKQYKVLRLGYI